MSLTVVCYRAVDEAGVCHDLMTRFREEYYVPEAKKDKRAKQAQRSLEMALREGRSPAVRELIYRRSRPGRHRGPKAEKRLI